MTSGFLACISGWGFWEVQVCGEVDEASVARPHGGGSGWLAWRGWGWWAVRGSPSVCVLYLVAFHSMAGAWAQATRDSGTGLGACH